MYLSHGELGKRAQCLAGFPTNKGDARRLEIGNLDPQYGGGGVTISISCVDSVGHAVASTQMRTEQCKAMGETESVALVIPVEAGAIDRFVQEAELVHSDWGSMAYLKMANCDLDWVIRMSLR